MNILIVHNYYIQTGGENIYVNELYKNLKKTKNKVLLFKKESESIKKNYLKGFFVFKKMIYDKKINEQFLYIIKKFQPDIIHINNLYPLINPSIVNIAKDFNIPVVQTIHNYKYICPNGFLFRNGKICKKCIKKTFTYPAITYNCYRNSKTQSIAFSSAIFLQNLIYKYIDKIDLFIFPSNFSKNIIVKNLSIPIKKTKVLPHFSNVIKMHKKNFKKKDYFLYIGRISEEKGIIQLLKVFKELKNIKLIVIGDGPLLKPAIKNYGNCKNIKFLGFQNRNKIFNHLQKSIGCIIPSLFYEVGPMVLFESFSCGTPVIVPFFATFKERVKNNINGIFYKQNDLNDLKHKILYLFNNKKLAQKMGKNAYNEYFKKYTIDIYTKKLLNIFNKVINESKRI